MKFPVVINTNKELIALLNHLYWECPGCKCELRLETSKCECPAFEFNNADTVYIPPIGGV